MNKRLEEMATQVGIDLNYLANTKQIILLEAWAQLIVRECADISDASFHNGSAGYLAIIKHFEDVQ